MNNQFLCCRLCSIPYDQVIHLPRLLNDCGHTVCERCIKQQEGHFRCPADETLYEYPIDGFPINASLFKLIQLKQQEQQKQIENLSISMCSSQQESIITNSLTQNSSITNVSENLSEIKSKTELLNLIEKKFNQVIARLEIRKIELIEQIEKKYEQYPIPNLNIEFALQMDVLVPRYGTLREILNENDNNFITFTQNNTYRSPSKKIFDQSPQVTIRAPLIRTKESEIQKIIRRLTKSENIENLQLKHKGINDDDLKILSQSLATSVSYIKTLNMSKNEITDDGFILIIDALWTNKTIKTLKLRDNQITQKSLDYLLQIYEDQKINCLQYIHLQGNKIENEQQITKLKQLSLIVYI